MTVFILFCKRQKPNFPAFFQQKHELEERETKNIAYAVMDWTESWETKEMENLETRHTFVIKCCY